MPVTRGRIDPAYYDRGSLSDRDEYPDDELLWLLEANRNRARADTVLAPEIAQRVFVHPIEIELERRQIQYSPEGVA